MENQRQITFFNLPKAENGAVARAIVRILHTSTKTIEVVDVHSIMVDDKHKFVKCLGENCPLCKEKIAVTPKAYVHIWDFKDNAEKVWVRPVSVIKSIETLETAYGDLSKFVVTIVRDDSKGKYPTYSILSRIDSPNYASQPAEMIDNKVAYRFHLTRSAEEIEQYMNTGIMPAHEKKFVSKEQYFSKKEKTTQTFVPAQKTTVNESNSGWVMSKPVTTTTHKYENNSITSPEDFDPFGGF